MPRIEFVRHCESEYNVAVKEHKEEWSPVKYIDQDDNPPLTETGVAQSRDLAIKFASENIKRIYTSPKIRTIDTARSIQIQQFNRVDIVEIAELTECKWGEMQGILTNHDTIIQQWRNGITPENAEGFLDFKSRVIKCIKILETDIRKMEEEEEAKQNENDNCYLVVTHGGFIKMVLELLNRPYQKIPNVGIISLTFNELCAIS